MVGIYIWILIVKVCYDKKQVRGERKNTGHILDTPIRSLFMNTKLYMLLSLLGDYLVCFVSKKVKIRELQILWIAILILYFLVLLTTKTCFQVSVGTSVSTFDLLVSVILLNWACIYTPMRSAAISRPHPSPHDKPFPVLKKKNRFFSHNFKYSVNLIIFVHKALQKNTCIGCKT